MKLRESLPSFVVTVLGVGLAWLGITVGWWILPVPVLLGIVVGWRACRHGERLVPDAPEEAVRWMEWSVLLPGAVAVAVQALLIALGIRLGGSKSASSVEIRELQTATVGAVATFLVVTFVRAAEEADERWVGKKVQEAFQRAMERYWRFPAGSDGEKAVHSDGWKGLYGWGRDARRGRAREVAKALARGEGIRH